MYRCTDCGLIFETPDIIYDDPSPSGISLPPGSYEYDVCPKCASDNIQSLPEDYEDIVGEDKYGTPLYEDEEGNIAYDDGEIYLDKEDLEDYDPSTELRKIFEKKREEIRHGK